MGEVRIKNRSIMKINVAKYIYSALSAITGLTVYPVIADFESATPTTPFCVFQRTSMNPQYTKSLYTQEIEHSYSITVADNEYTNTLAMAQQVIDTLMALTSKTNTDFRFGQVTVNDLSEDYVDGIFIQTISITINTIEL